MTGLAPSALVLLAASFGGLGLPLGVPPEPENPVMAYAAPDECLFYASWAARAQADPQSNNHTEQLLAEEEVQRFAGSLERAVLLFLHGPVPRSRDGQVDPLSQISPLVIRALTTRSTAVFIDQIDLTEKEPKIRGGLLVEAGDQSAEIVGLLEKFLTSRSQQLEPVQLGRVTGHRLMPSQGGPPMELAFASAGPYVLIGVGEQSLDDMVRRIAAKKTPAWLTEIGQRLPVERRASVSYINTPVLIDKLLPLAGPGGAEFAEKIGVEQLGEILGVVGLDDEGLISRSLVKLNGEPTGFLKLLNGEGIETQDLDFLPRDAMFAFAVSLDAGQAYELFEQSTADSPDGAEFFEQFNAGFERQFKQRLREDVLAALGDVWTVSASSVDGWTGTTATVEVKDPQVITAFADELARSAMGQTVEVMKFEGFEVHAIAGRDSLIRPAWCVTENRLIVGLSAQAVKGAVALTKEERGLLNSPRLEGALAGNDKVISVSYQDTAEIFESTYSYLPLLIRGIQMQMGRRGPQGASGPSPVNWVTHYLPSARSIHRHLQPSISVTRLTKDGIETESHSTIPMLNIGGSAPLVVALGLPAVQSARAASQRMQSSNNLKQIAIALHNYHDTYRHLPPAYVFNKDKKPGLSWRVQILPFIEQQALYDQFRMDEPWDSEHNKQLISKMPEVYRSPASKAGEGKTVYLGVGGPSGMFPPPTPPADPRGHTQGLRFASVTDGLSKTIGVVEASDESAVIWTKPDDYVPDADAPFKGLLGLHRNSFQVALMDGSVRFLSDKLDPEMLRRLLKRDDSLPVDFEATSDRRVDTSPPRRPSSQSTPERFPQPR